MSDARFALVATAAYVLVAGFAALHHEMWRDEIQAWLLARDSRSVGELLGHMKYEGHPPLWHLCLMPITRLTSSPAAMQVLHLAFAAGTMYLAARFGPFTRSQTLLLGCGYLFLFEYSVVCRNYAPGIFLLCLFAVLRRREDTGLSWTGAAVLFLACHTNVYALIVVIALLGAIVLQSRVGCAHQRSMNRGGNAVGTAHPTGVRFRISSFGFPLNVGLVALGIATAAWQMLPPEDSGFAVGWRTGYEPAYAKWVLAAPQRAYLPLPKPGPYFWNSHVLEDPPADVPRAVLSVLVLAWAVLLLRRRPIALAFFLAATGGLLAFYYLKYSGGIRHEGFLFVAFVLALWLFPQEESRLWPALVESIGGLVDRTRRPALTGLLGLQAAGGLVAVTMDARHTFSAGKETAHFIRAHGLGDLPIIAEPDYATETVVGYLQKDRVHYPRADRQGSFIVWNKSRTQHTADFTPLPDERILAAAQAVGADALLLLNRPLSEETLAGCPVTQLAGFGSATVGDERFFVYRYHAGGLDRPAVAAGGDRVTR